MQREKKKYTGTMVTPQVFNAWKVKFESEMKELESKRESKG